MAQASHPSAPGVGEAADPPAGLHPNYVTERGLAQLNARLADFEARLASHPGEAESEREHLLHNIRWLQSRIASAVPVRTRINDRDRVGFGARVDVIDEDGRRGRYRIVGEDEADPERGLVSWLSPLARALTGARRGDTVVWRRPDGDIEVEVQRISFDETPDASDPPDLASRSAAPERQHQDVTIGR